MSRHHALRRIGISEWTLTAGRILRQEGSTRRGARPRHFVAPRLLVPLGSVPVLALCLEAVRPQISATTP